MNPPSPYLDEPSGPLHLVPGYARLPERFFARLAPQPVARPRLLALNRALAADLGLDVESLGEDRLTALFSGNAPPRPGETIAAAYAGHQFGHFVPQLGDGRALLLGDLRDRTGVRRELQLKGSGRTPFSRSGDGRAALGPVLREYLVSEAMHALGIPTTRALAAVATGETVMREEVLPGAILTRVAASHVRVGTFEYFAARRDLEGLRALADYTIERHYPRAADAPRPHLALLDGVVERQASLVARWMLVGFVHGVMNTDNMAVSGETIDYGPCAFMDAYDPATCFSAIDRHGRYAYVNQPHAALWNLERFAAAILTLIDAAQERAVELARAALERFSVLYERHFQDGMRAKLGIGAERAGDAELARAWLELLHRNAVDFTVAHRRLADGGARELFADAGEFDRWEEAWRARLALEPEPFAARAAVMRSVNPAVIPRNHQVERAIDAAAHSGDLSPFVELSAALARPYERQERFAAFAEPPLPSERVLRTFCGT